jgi:hypothetical protein
MSTTKNLWRIFFSYSDPEQEAWLESLGRQGWHLAQVAPLRFRFVQGEAREDRYRMDYQLLRGKQRENYLQLFLDAGWDLVGQSGYRYYFRARADAFSSEVYSDADSRKNRLRREMGFAGALLALTAWSTSHTLGRMIGSERINWSWTLPVLLALSTMLILLWCVWRLARAQARTH